MDLIPILPLQFLRLKNNRERLFFLLKVIRIFKGTKMLSQRKLMRVIKERQLQYITKRCEWDDEFANDIFNQRNQMEAILFTSYGLKTLELTIVLMHFSYMLGMFWLIMCEVVEDFYHGVNYFELGIDKA
jgi:hypothetical protein